MNTSQPLYTETQPYRDLPPFTLLVLVGALFGWFLIIWDLVLGRPLGALDLPPWLAAAIALPLAVLLPIAYFRLRMVTEVYSDRVVVNNGMTGRVVLPLADVAAVEVRTDDIRGDYNVRNVGAVRNTRVAYTVTSDDGAQLQLADGRLFLIGSKQPEALGAAILSAWRLLTAPQNELHSVDSTYTADPEETHER
jgi:hypothetical protein